MKAFLAIVLLAAIGVGAWFLLGKEEAAPEPAAATSEPEAEVEETAEETADEVENVVEEVKEEAETKIDEVKEEVEEKVEEVKEAAEEAVEELKPMLTDAGRGWIRLTVSDLPSRRSTTGNEEADEVFGPVEKSGMDSDDEDTGKMQEEKTPDYEII